MNVILAGLNPRPLCLFGSTTSFWGAGEGRPTSCKSSQVRDQTDARAMTWAIAVTASDTNPLSYQGSPYLDLNKIVPNFLFPFSYERLNLYKHKEKHFKNILEVFPEPHDIAGFEHSWQTKWHCPVVHSKLRNYTFSWSSRCGSMR